jgi:hypothetical protein
MVKRIEPEQDEVRLQETAETALEEDVVHEDQAPADELPKRAKLNADGTVTLTLLYPTSLKVVAAGEVRREDHFEQLTFHRMTGGDLMALQATSAETVISAAFARSTKLNPAIATALFRKLDAADARAAGEVIGFFLNGGGRTGR